ncbi:MAG TPA: PIG-L family deacetylase [Candidatus Sulfotelmatobacter sp.]|nr:PIG-L family deacetylase [Candidatus Sulfotelmatobacter sp.]
MKFSNPQADIYVPDPALTPEDALRKVTHLCVAAHQDDIEIMAQSGISDCLDRPGRAFGGVVVTNGAGSPRSGSYGSYSDEQMQAVRREEQRAAAKLGRYSIQLQLAYPSADAKRPGHAALASDLATIFSSCRPEVVYLHNPADKHDTHVAVLLRCLEAILALPQERRPARVLGCEVWRDLDWLPDSEKVALDSGRHPKLARKLLAVFESQIGGGKRYDLAAIGRRSANATFFASHATDNAAGITWAMDLTPVTRDGGPSVEEFTASLIAGLASDVAQRLGKLRSPAGASGA